MQVYIHGTGGCRCKRVANEKASRLLHLGQPITGQVLISWGEGGREEEGFICPIDRGLFLEDMEGLKVAQTFVVRLSINNIDVLYQSLSCRAAVVGVSKVVRYGSFLYMTRYPF